jgi:tRNA dimethylallyltransferase
LEGRTIPVLAGCTASGKSAAAMSLAGGREFEIVNADSRQIYRGMDIGTAKPGREETGRVRHHLYDIADPDETFSAGRYCRLAGVTMDSIFESGSTPLLVGGSGLYIMAVTGSLDELPGRNDRMRAVLSDIEGGSPGALHGILAVLDGETASVTDPADVVRLQRALEIILQSGMRASDLRTGGEGSGDGFRVVVIETEGDELRRRIRGRTAEMFARGLVEEVECLAAKGYGRDSVLGRTIGYREILDYMDGAVTLDGAREAVEVNTWRLARRQRNMFRRLKGAVPWNGRDTGELGEMLFGNGFRRGGD